MSCNRIHKYPNTPMNNTLNKILQKSYYYNINHPNYELMNRIKNHT